MRYVLLPLWLWLMAVGALCGGVQAAEREYRHIVVLGDPHLPGKHLSAKAQVIRTINAWNDVDLVVVVGDICEDLGTVDEYAAAKQFFADLQKPAAFVAGNHDYIYDDAKSASGTRIKGAPSVRATKLARFKEVFGLAEVYSARRLGEYALIFLSTDHLLSNRLAELSGQQLAWLKGQLEARSTTPTLVFFHAPLKGTLADYRVNANKANFVAQPEREIHELLLQHSQVLLWVSGHMHTPATNESYAGPINVYEGRVTNIHNADLNRDRIWTNSLYLYSDRVVVKTFDHKKGAWVADLERTVKASHS
jgi:Icc protein